MKEQRQEKEWIMSCWRSLRLMWGCTKHLYSHIFAVVVDVVTKLAKDGELCELLYADDLVLMSETTEGLR